MALAENMELNDYLQEMEEEQGTQGVGRIDWKGREASSERKGGWKNTMGAEKSTKGVEKVQWEWKGDWKMKELNWLKEEGWGLNKLGHWIRKESKLGMGG